MKTPRFELSPNATQALLLTKQFVWCDIYTFILAGAINGGTPLRYSTGDVDINDLVFTWSHAGPLFDQNSSSGTKSTAHWKRGLDVDTWQIVVQPRQTDPITGAAFPDKIGSVPWLSAARGGALDGATVLVERAFLPSWPQFPRLTFLVPTGIVNIFTGRVATIDIGRTSATISINSHLELLGISMPRNFFQAPCMHTLFDAGCALASAPFKVSSTIRLVSTQPSILGISIGNPAGSGTYNLGRIVMTGGANAGLSRTVREWIIGPAGFGGLNAISLMSAFPFTMNVGDAFDIYPGCDKQMATCNQFGNIANFGGEPYIPVPETAV